MRKIVFVLVSAAFLIGPAYAQDRTAQSAPPKVEQTDATPTHEMCKAVMGRHMEGKPPHDHGRDKMGPMTWPDGKPLTAAEMEKMHRDCAARMQNPAPPATQR